MPSIAELGQAVKQKYPGAYDSMDDNAVGRLVKQKYPDAYTQFADSAATDTTQTQAPEQQPDIMRALTEYLGSQLPGQEQLNAGIDALPAIGGGVGAMMGGGAGTVFGAGVGAVPGAIGGGALGAAGGESARQLINRAIGRGGPSSGLEAAGHIALQGGLGATGEGLGLGAAKAGSKLAKPIMAKALKPAQDLVANFRTVVSDALKERVSVGKLLGELGSEKASAIRKTAAQNVKSILNAATQRGVMLDRTEMAQPALEAMEAKFRRPLDPDEEAHIIQMVSQRSGQLLTRATMGIPRGAVMADPILANEIRRLAREEAKTAMKGKSMGLPPAAIPDLDAHIEAGARRALNHHVSGYQPAQMDLARKIGVERAVKGAELRPTPPNVGLGAAGFHVGVGVPPELASRLALLMDDPMIGSLISNLFRTAQGAGTAAMQPGTAP